MAKYPNFCEVLLKKLEKRPLNEPATSWMTIAAPTPRPDNPRRGPPLPRCGARRSVGRAVLARDGGPHDANFCCRFLVPEPWWSLWFGSPNYKIPECCLMLQRASNTFLSNESSEYFLPGRGNEVMVTVFRPITATPTHITENSELQVVCGVHTKDLFSRSSPTGTSDWATVIRYVWSFSVEQKAPHVDVRHVPTPTSSWS